MGRMADGYERPKTGFCVKNLSDLGDQSIANLLKSVELYTNKEGFKLAYKKPLVVGEVLEALFSQDTLRSSMACLL